MTESVHLRVCSGLGIGSLSVLLTLWLGVGGNFSTIGPDNGSVKRLDDLTQPPVEPSPAIAESAALPDIALSFAESVAKPRHDLKLVSPVRDESVASASTLPAEVEVLRLPGAPADANREAATLESSFDFWAGGESAKAAAESSEVQKITSPARSAVLEIATPGLIALSSPETASVEIASGASAMTREQVAVAVPGQESPSGEVLAVFAEEAKVTLAAVAGVVPQGAVEPQSEGLSQTPQADSQPGLVPAREPATATAIAREMETPTAVSAPQPAPKLAVADWNYVLPAQVPVSDRQGFVASATNSPLALDTGRASSEVVARPSTGNPKMAQGANSGRSVPQSAGLTVTPGRRRSAEAGFVSRVQGGGKYRLAGSDIEFQLPVLANGIPVGNLTLHVAPNQNLSLRLQELVNLFQDRIDPQLLNSMTDSPNIEAFVSFDRLREAGIEIRYDAAHDRLTLSARAL